MNANDTILDSVTEFARKAHGDQKRKYSPDPYIVHPIRVMQLCREYTSDVSTLAAALLHDVLEDTETGEAEIKSFLLSVMSPQEAGKTLAIVVELTDVFIKKDYPAFNRRKRKNLELQRIEKTSPEAQTIKYADIIDNSREIGVHDPDFAKVFLLECKQLLHKIPNGNPDLYKKALETVEAGLNALPKSKNATGRNIKKKRI